MTALRDLNLSNNRIYDFSPLGSISGINKNRGFAKQLFELEVKDNKVILPTVKDIDGSVLEFDKNNDGSIKLYKSTYKKGSMVPLMTEVDGIEQPVKIDIDKGLLKSGEFYTVPEELEDEYFSVHWLKSYQKWGAITFKVVKNNNIVFSESIDKNGALESENGWKKSNENWYYTENSKIKKNQWAKIDNKWYRFDEEGKMFSKRWHFENKRWYWLNENGRLSQNEWVFVDGNWFWAYSDGVIAENEWILVNNKWYYAKRDGYIVTSQTFKIGDKIYRFNSNGEMID